MDFSKVGLFTALKQKMRYSSERQSLLAKNIANANVPGYKAVDLKPVAFDELVSASSGKLEIATTQPGHMRPQGGMTKFRVNEQKSTFETTPVGNNVVLEEQAMKMAENNTDYQTTTSIYKKMVEMFRLAGGGNR